MRTSLVFASSILLAGCAGGVYVPPSTTVATAPRKPAPAPVVATPAPRPAPVVLPPVGVTITRVEESRLQVSTNQPAYLVVFEIMPGRGASLVYPQSAHERPMELIGTNWLQVSWPSARFAADDRYRRRDRGMGVGDPRRRDDRMSRRYIYAIASERPLRLPDRAYDRDRLRDLLDARAAYADDPYETMTALSRRFVPAQMSELAWGEDAYTIEVADARVARVTPVTCRDGSVIYVREDRADRDWCASHGGRGTNARPNDTHGDTRGGERIYRLPRPEVVQAGTPANGGQPSNGDADNRQGRGNSPTYEPPRRGGDADTRQGRGNSPTYEPPRGNGDADIGQGRGTTPTNPPNRGNDGADIGQGRGNNGNHYGRDAGSDTLKRNGNSHGNEHEKPNGNGQSHQNGNAQGTNAQNQNGNAQGNNPRGENGNSRGNDQQSQDSNVRGADQQKPLDRRGWMQPRAMPPVVRSAPVEGAGEPRPVADPPVVKAAPPEVKPAPAEAAPAPSAEQPRRPAKDSTDGAPEHRRPSPKARPDSSSDKPAGDERPMKQIE